MTTGERLRDERKRMGLSQSGMGERAGVTKMSQINYEKDARAPDATYLAAIAAAGADIQYILTGTPSAQALTRDEVELLAAFRAAPLAVKAAAIGALQGGSNPQPAGIDPVSVKQKISGKAGQVVGINTGEVNGSSGRAGDKGKR